MDERFMVWWTLRGERLLKPAACTSCVARGLLANDKGVSLFFKENQAFSEGRANLESRLFSSFRKLNAGFFNSRVF